MGPNAASGLDREQVAVLGTYGIAAAPAEYVVFIAGQLAKAGGPDRSTYWRTPRPQPLGTPESLRDEMLFFGVQGLSTMQALLTEKQRHPYAEQFAAAFAYVGRSVVQSIESVDRLATSNCYIDALSICRTLISRTNLLILFALNPWLFDDWLLRPADQKYLDGRIRDLLASHGLEWFGRLYDELSEAIHLQQTLLDESGYLSPGLFPSLPPMRARTYVIAKILFGAVVALGVAVARQDSEGAALPGTLALSSDCFDQTRDLLAANRIEHVGVTIAPDRHWTPAGKGKYAVMTYVGIDQLADQISKFHRDSGQRKVLRQPYRFTDHDAAAQRASIRSQSSNSHS